MPKQSGVEIKREPSLKRYLKAVAPNGEKVRVRINAQVYNPKTQSYTFSAGRFVVTMEQALVEKLTPCIEKAVENLG